MLSIVLEVVLECVTNYTVCLPHGQGYELVLLTVVLRLFRFLSCVLHVL